MSEIADVLPINLSWSSRQKILIMLQKVVDELFIYHEI